MATKVLAKYIFDKSKIEVVGSPTITEDGIASGFSATNYIRPLSTLDISSSTTTNIVIKLDFETAQDVTTSQYILHSAVFAQFSLFVKNGVLNSSLGDGSNWIYNFTNMINIESNSKYSIEIEISKTIVKYIIFKNKIYLNTLTYDGTLLQNNHDMRFVIGVTRSFNTPFLGSIDLKQFSTKANNKLIYSPTKPITYLEHRKEGFDKSKFEVVGLPTITEDGVASGFSGADCILSKEIDFSDCDTWDYTIKINTNSLSIIQFLGGFGNSANFGMSLNINTDATLALNLSSNGSTWDLASNLKSSLKILANTDYFIRRSFDGANYKVDVSTDNKSWINYITLKSSRKINPIKLTPCYGNFSKLSRPINGLFYLSSILLYKNSKEIFNGQKDKYYVLQV